MNTNLVANKTVGDQSSPLAQLLQQFQNPWRYLLGIAIFSTLLLLVDIHVGWHKVWLQWQQVHLSLLVLALLLFISSHLVRAYRIHSYLSTSHPTRWLPILKISTLHQFANNLLPMKLGELVLPLLLRRYYGIKLLDGGTSLIWLRLMDFLVIAIIATLVLCDALGYGVLFLALLLVYACIKYRQFWLGWLQTIPPVKTFFYSLKTTAPTSFLLQLQLLSCTLISWLLKLLAISLIIISMLNVDLFGALAAALGGELSGLLPIQGIAGTGSYEATFFAGGSLQEIPKQQLLAAAINAHLFIFSATSLTTLLVLLLPKQLIHTQDTAALPMENQS